MEATTDRFTTLGLAPYAALEYIGYTTKHRAMTQKRRISDPYGRDDLLCASWSFLTTTIEDFPSGAATKNTKVK
jgi:hypothetical protein